MPRKSETLKFPEEDQAFLDRQADALGCDAQTYLRMVVRQMRLGQLPTLGFGAGGWPQPMRTEILLDQDLRARLQPELSRPEFPTDPAQWGQPAPLPEQNDPAEDFNFNAEQVVAHQPQQQSSHVPSLVDEMARLATAEPQDSSRAHPPSPNSVTALRRSLRSSTAPQISGPPGTATRIIGVNQHIARDAQGDGRGNVQRQNMKHFFGR